MKRTVHALVSGEDSALFRVTAVFSRQKLNIASLTFKRSGDTNGTSDMKIVTDVENERQARQLISQLNKLVDVISAADISELPDCDKEKECVAPEINPGC